MTDAVVIGAGPNGLAAAIRLAESGRSVLVCEAADAPGGAVRSQELTLPGFIHDTFSAVYPAGAASPVFARMPLARHGLELVQPRACAATPLDGGRAAVLYPSLDETAASLNAIQPGDGDAWRDFVTPFVEHFTAVRRTMLSGFPPVRGPLEMLGRMGPGGLLRFASLLPGTSRGLAHRLFQNPGTRAWLHGSAMHGDTPIDKPGSAIAGFYLLLLGHVVGWPSPRGGAERLTDALVAYLHELGGEIRVNAPVERIASSGNRVTGVHLAGGEWIPAKTVIADVMPHALVAMTGDALRSYYRRMLERYRYGSGTIKVDWALDGPIPWENESVRHAGTVHVTGDEQQLQSQQAPFVLVGQQSIADPTRAPEGQHTAWGYQHDLRFDVDAMEAQIERFAPGFRDRIIGRHVMGPQDLEARNRNLVGGDVGGGSYVLHQTVFRPMPKLTPYATPLRGLFLGSAATFPGGAVHGVPGDSAARTALKEA